MRTATPAPARIALVTDFGDGPYVGQMELRLAALAPAVPVIRLISDLPPWRPDLAAYLLPALRRGMPGRTLYLCIVDPGVGSDRAILALRAGEDWLLAPDNGLLVPLLRRAPDVELLRIDWQPEDLSASFHGRDLFVPVAANLCAGQLPASRPLSPETLVGADWSDQCPAICYVDDFGNLITGVDAHRVPSQTRLLAAGRRIARARTFSDVAIGEPFWYRNAFDLVEIAVNQGRADALLGLGVGDTFGLDGV